MREYISKIKENGTLFITLIPILGYISAYFYALGKFAFYRIPAYLIQVTLENAILSSIVSAFLLILIYLMWYGLPSNKAQQKPRPATSLKQAIILTIASPISVLALTIIIQKVNIGIFIVSSIIIFLLFFISYFILPFIKYQTLDIRKFKSIFYKYQEDETKSKLEAEKLNKRGKIKNLKIPILSRLINNQTDREILIYAVFLLSWTGFAYFYGNLTARVSDVHTLLSRNDKNYIIAGTYQQNLVGISVDILKSITTDEVLLIPLDKNLIINTRRIGTINYRLNYFGR